MKDDPCQRRSLVSVKSFINATRFCLGALALGQMISLSISVAAASQAWEATMNVRKEFDLPTPGAAVAVTWSPDGSAIAAASDYGGILTVWNANGHLINQIKRSGGGPALGGSIAFVQGSEKLLFLPPQNSSNDTALNIWDVAKGDIVGSVPGPQPGGDYARNRTDHFQTSPDQKTLAAGTAAIGNNLIIYDLQEKRVLQDVKINGGIFSLCVFGDGRLVAAGSARGLVTVLDTKAVSTPHEFQAYEQSKFGDLFLEAIAGSPDGELLLVGVGQVGLNGKYYKSPEAKAWQSSIDSVRILNVRDGSRLASFTSATPPIRQAMWDPKGRYVAFVDNAHSLYLWQLSSLDGVPQKIDLPSSTLALAISPDSKRIGVTMDNGIRVFSIN